MTEQFTSTAVNHMRMFLILFCTALALQLLRHWRAQAAFFQTQPVHLYGPPPVLLGRWPMPALSEKQFLLAGGALLTGLLGALLGRATRFWLLLALLGALFYFSQILGLAWVQRKVSLLPLVLLVLLVAPGSDLALRDAAPAWPLWLIKLCLAQMYFSAGLEKLRHTGWAWADGTSLQAYLVEHHLWGDTPQALWLAQRLWLCRVLSVLTLAFELSFWLLLLWPMLRWLYAPAGLLFHLGTALTMRIHYLRYLGPVYLVFATDAAFALLSWWGK